MLFNLDNVRIVSGSCSCVYALLVLGSMAVLLPVLEPPFNLLTTNSPVQMFEMTMVKTRIANGFQLVDCRSCHVRLSVRLSLANVVSTSESVSWSLSKRSLS